MGTLLDRLLASWTPDYLESRYLGFDFCQRYLAPSVLYLLTSYRRNPWLHAVSQSAAGWSRQAYRVCDSGVGGANGTVRGQD